MASIEDLLLELGKSKEEGNQEKYDQEYKKISDLYAEFCKQKKLPNFAFDKCFSCRKKVFEKWNGKEYITGCPFCSRTFCD